MTLGVIPKNIDTTISLDAWNKITKNTEVCMMNIQKDILKLVDSKEIDNNLLRNKLCNIVVNNFYLYLFPL